MRLLPLIAFLCLAAALALGLMTPAPERQTPAQSQLLGQPFPALSVTPLDGEPDFQTTLANGKVTVVNMFASWCAPCEVEMPELQALRGIDGDVQVLGVAWHDRKKTLLKWKANKRVPFDGIWLAPNDVGVTLGIRGVPETYILDRRGVLRYHLPEPIVDAERTQVIVPLIEKLLHE